MGASGVRWAVSGRRDTNRMAWYGTVLSVRSCWRRGCRCNSPVESSGVAERKKRNAIPEVSSSARRRGVGGISYTYTLNYSKRHESSPALTVPRDKDLR